MQRSNVHPDKLMSHRYSDNNIRFGYRVACQVGCGFLFLIFYLGKKSRLRHCFKSTHKSDNSKAGSVSSLSLVVFCLLLIRSVGLFELGVALYISFYSQHTNEEPTSIHPEQDQDQNCLVRGTQVMKG